jgi:hypothetical protein
MSRWPERTLAERFWEKVDKSGDCWEWTGAKTSAGYGVFGMGGGKTRGSQRVAYELTHGGIPEGMEIDHICHNRGCVNPQHLRLATRKQNNENRGVVSAKSGVRGVSWNKGAKKWQGQVVHFGEHHHLGYFSTIEDAAVAVTAKRNELFTHNDADRRAA